MVQLNSSDLMTDKEAEKRWGLTSGYVSKSIKSGQASKIKGQYRYFGNQLVITSFGMEELTNKKNPINKHQADYKVLNIFFIMTMRELDLESKFAIKAKEQFDHFEDQTKPQFIDDEKAMLYLQLLLGSVANISKLVSPSTRQSFEVRKVKKLIKRTLRIHDNSVLLNRKARNGLAHIDERLYEVSKSKQDQNVALISVSNSKTNLILNDEDRVTGLGKTLSEKNASRYYHRDTKVIEVFGEEIDLNLLSSELRTLKNRLVRILKRISKLESEDVNKVLDFYL